MKQSLQAGERLDRYLIRLGWAPSRRAAAELIARGRVRVNGRDSRKGAVVLPGDRVEVDGATQAITIAPNPALPLVVLYEDASVVVVDKPGLIPCHPLREGERNTVMNAVVARYPETAQVSDKPNEGGLVHRLDNGTSGALLIARDSESLATLRGALRTAQIRRRYVALAAGRIDEPFEVSTPIAHHPKNPRRMIAADSADAARGLRAARPAATTVEPIELLGRFTLLSVTPRTGSRHQIRVHLASRGFPLAGDTLYGGPPLEPLAQGRVGLHLAELEFDSPSRGRVSIKAPLAADLIESIDRLRRRPRSVD